MVITRIDRHGLNRFFECSAILLCDVQPPQTSSVARPPKNSRNIPLVRFTAQEYEVAVGRYVLMPDHVHLFVSLPSTGITLQKWVQALRAVIGKQLLKLGFDKPHWQKGFFDHLLRTDESYSQKWDYVRMNPVRAGLGPIAKIWPYQGEILNLRFD